MENIEIIQNLPDSDIDHVGIKIKIPVPKIPSVNMSHIRTKHNTVALRPEVKAFQKSIYDKLNPLLSKNLDPKMLYNLDITFHVKENFYKRDLDNMEKHTIDGIFSSIRANDMSILQKHTKKIVSNYQSEAVEITMSKFKNYYDNFGQVNKVPFKVEVDKFISLNKAYSYRGMRKFLTKEMKEYKENLLTTLYKDRDSYFINHKLKADKGIIIEFYLNHKRNLDLDNMEKHTIDEIARFYKFNDVRITEKITTKKFITSEVEFFKFTLFDLKSVPVK